MQSNVSYTMPSNVSLIYIPVCSANECSSALCRSCTDAVLTDGRWRQNPRNGRASSAELRHACFRRIARRPSDTCPDCNGTACPMARCLVCDEEPDTRGISCCAVRASVEPASTHWGTSSVLLGDLRGYDRTAWWAALAAGFRSSMSRQASLWLDRS